MPPPCEIGCSNSPCKIGLRPPCKSGDFQYVACDCVSLISLLHHEFVFFIVFHFEPILASDEFFGYFFDIY